MDINGLFKHRFSRKGPYCVYIVNIFFPLFHLALDPVSVQVAE